MDAKKTKEQLATAYADPTWREEFLRILNVVQILRTCVIGKDYRVTDDMHNAIYLTQTGAECLQSLQTKHDVPVKEAKLICFLTTVYREPLVDVIKTNYPVLVDEISAQIKDGRIRHAFVFGRSLYDTASQLFPDERDYLNTKDTARLLQETPAGVWQVDDLVLGPYGVIPAHVRRRLTPHSDVPLQHCADMSCSTVHYVQLSTDREAPVNMHRHKMIRLLEQGDKEPSDWNGFIDDLLAARESATDGSDQDTSGLFYLLGDALADSELRTLTAAVLDGTQGRVRDLLLKQVNLKVASAAGAVERMGRAELLQALLLASDEEVIAELNALVGKDEIVVPPGEVRRPRVNSAERAGMWHLSAELSCHGVRFVSTNKSLPMLRLDRLIKSMYKTDLVDDMQELDWQLRAIDGLTPGGKLAEFMRTRSPREILATLVMARRENVAIAGAALGVTLDSGITTDDAALVTRLLWKLGFNTGTVQEPHARLLSRHDELAGLTRTAQLSSAVDEEPIRKAASVYFQDLELFLTDSLTYVTWALTNDHYASERPWVYRASVDRADALQRLTVAAQGRGEDINFADDLTIYPLIRGFSILAEYLGGLNSADGTYQRPPAGLPMYLERTDLKRFPFLHTMPYLDLREDSQKHLLEGLRSVTDGLTTADVAHVRNDLIHFRRTSVDMGKVSEALEGVGRAVRHMDALGIIRNPYYLTRTVADEWGRSTLTFKSASGQQVLLTRPSAYDWLGLPSTAAEQYMMHGAVFAEPNEVLRFRLGHDSAYEDMWAAYPARRAAKDNSVAKQSEGRQSSRDLTGRPITRIG